MRSYREFCFTIVAVLVFTVAGKSVGAQTAFEVEFFKNGVYHTNTYILGNHEWYGDTNSCQTHRTQTSSPGKSFAHVHVDVPNPLVAYEAYTNPVTGIITFVSVGSFTTYDVQAYWNKWFLDEVDSGRRANVQSFGCYAGEDLTYNCYGYALGYDTWIQDPGPIYLDDYMQVPDTPPIPKTGNIIVTPGHVLTISAVDQSEIYNPLVVGTAEKFRHSGIYYFLYKTPGGCMHYDYRYKK